MKNNCDLHTHSYFSDGSVSPTELVNMAEEIGLSAIVLCDHNTVGGLDEFIQAGKGKNVQTIPAVEFSTDYEEIELHIIAMFVKKEHYGKITEMMDEVQRRKEKSNIDLIERLSKAGYGISFEEIKAKSHTGKINRAHIAAELLAKGYVSSVQEAFKQMLKPSLGYYIPPKRPDSFEMISFIRSIGAVPVLAHPFLNLKTEDELRAFLGKAVECGLAGMEVLYPLFSDSETAAAKSIADEFGLIPSGGSDFHGTNKPDIRLGEGSGELNVPYEYFVRLKNFADKVVK